MLSMQAYNADHYEFTNNSWYDLVAGQKILQQRLQQFTNRVNVHAAFCKPFTTNTTGAAPSEQGLSIQGLLNTDISNNPAVHVVSCYKDHNHFTSLIIDTRGARPVMYYHDPLGQGVPSYMEAQLSEWLNTFYPGANLAQVLHVTTNKVQTNNYDCGPYSIRFCHDLAAALVANLGQTQNPELYCRALSVSEIAQQRLSDAKHLHTQLAAEQAAGADITATVSIDPALQLIAATSTTSRPATVFWNPSKAEQEINQLLDSGADAATVNAAIEKVLAAATPSA